MRKTLRRSCDACARSKLACDLQTPRCSRCAKRNSSCVYANQPLSAAANDGATVPSPRGSPIEDNTSVMVLVNPGIQSFDPFDTYPQTRLSRPYVQRLIQHFLSHIAFQYYPLDLDIMSNPFVVSWWPSALADPALFHVSLQTASLDLDLRAQKGFANSEILMADSVSLVRHKITNPISALQDETLNSIITLAAIEYGKGNTDVSALHIDGVKRLVKLRGGINHVKRINPLTARMVAWVCMIVTQTPQFSTQDSGGSDEGIAPISQWHQATSGLLEPNPVLFNIPLLDSDITDVLCRLHNLFDLDQHTLSSTDLHDLACYAVHKLLLWSPQPQADSFPCDLITSGIVRHALVLYLLIIHGPTYFSHAQLQYATALKLQGQMEHTWFNTLSSHGSLVIWLFSIGMVASAGLPEGQWFVSHARKATESLGLQTWNDIMVCLQNIVWLDTPTATHLFRQKWQEVLHHETT
ncbi:C6 zinc finger domain-containing protein [Stagonosporopsis vannaccii]|nr:C6 zinc finger domain-containing protein [Stagonosporopsis vannaccii]